MEYRKFGNTGFDVSILGLGCMRFPTKDGTCDSGEVNDDEAVKMIRYAIDNGVNYLDTAYVYHNGRSESITGMAIKKGYRSKVKLATKCPCFLIKNAGDFDRILEEQLKRLGVEHIDFYLMHALDGKTWDNVVKRFELMDKAEKAVKDGKLGCLGFSFHDGHEEFVRIIDEYDRWAFCQIQLNYLNEEYQAGLAGLRTAAEKGLGVAVMEPLLGGKLAKPVDGVMDIFNSAVPNRTAPEWALNYLWDMPEVHTVLSGMSSMEQLKENLSYAGKAKPNMLTEKDRNAIRSVQQKCKDLGGVPCTNCGYCKPCPSGVDIPRNFDLYNELFLYETPQLTKRSYSMFKSEHRGKKTAENCTECGECETKCPQHIPIPSLMKKVCEALS